MLFNSWQNIFAASYIMWFKPKRQQRKKHSSDIQSIHASSNCSSFRLKKGLAPLYFSLKQTSYYFNTNCIPWGIDHDTFNQEKFIYFHYDIRMNKKRLITLCKKWFTFVVDWVQLAMVQLCFKYLWWALYKIALILKDGEFQMLLYLFSIIIWIKRVQLETENFQNKSTTSHSQWKNNCNINN